MMKSVFLLFVGCVAINAAIAQKALAVYYLKSSGRQVAAIDKADNILTFLPPDSGVDNHLYIVKEYYSDGSLKYIGSSKTIRLYPIDPKLPYFVKPHLQGGYISFFPNGHKMQIGGYENGENSGDETDYYPNGKIYCTKTHVDDKKTTFNQCLDSAGKVLVENGNGKWLRFEDETFKNYLTGDVINGLQEGDWWGKRNDTVKIFETYKNGELKCSGSFDGSGRKIYVKVDSTPEFPGGMDGFYRFLGKNIQYPAIARQDNTQGRVVITFIVDESGALGSFFVTKSVSPEIDKEAMRVLTLSPKWKPGSVDGKPVRVSYGVPRNFTLSNN